MLHTQSPHSILSLDDDVIYTILSYCDIKSLGRMACSCRRLNFLANHDCVWLRLKKAIQLKISARKHDNINVKEECQLAKNWTNALFKDLRVLNYSVKQMPWLQLDENNKLWVSNKNVIDCFQQKLDGRLQKIPGRSIRDVDSQSDVTRFKSNSDIIVCGSRDGRICGYSCQRGSQLFKINGHTSDVQDVDFSDNIIISGSRDKTIKVWSMTNTENTLFKYSIPADDTVWSVAISPNTNSFVSGSAGRYHVPPLRLWDTERGCLLNSLGSEYKNGAGVLALHYESPHILFSGGYDTYIRMWDLRTANSECVSRWEEPFDSTIYTLRSDGDNSFITGSAQHGLVHLWDKRKTRPVQRYFVGRAHINSSTPVYSLAFSVRYMYVALDRGIHVLDFLKPGIR